MSIGYKLYKNNMPATSEKAPYLGMAVPAGSLAYDNILKEMIKAGTKMTQPTAKYFLDALYEYAAETIAAEKVRINLGTVSIYPMIDGSFDSEDANFDPERNSLYVGASFSQELRDRVAGIAPDIVDGQGAGTVKLHSCMDLETQVFKVIDGLNAFRLAGENLTVPDGSDESLALYAKDGVTKVTDIEVSETDGGQRIACHLKQGAVAIPKGTYKVRLASHGLDPTDPLTVATLTVTLTEAIPAPEPEPIGKSTDGTLVIMSDRANGADWAFTGSGFQAWEPGGRGIPRIDVVMGGASGQFDTFEVSEDGTEFVLSDPEQVKALTDQLEGPADGTARISFVPGSEASAETITVPIHYEPAV